MRRFLFTLILLSITSITFAQLNKQQIKDEEIIKANEKRIGGLMKYVDNKTAETLQLSKEYSDKIKLEAIFKSTIYTDQAKSDAISKSNAYSDVAKAESIAESKIYADEVKTDAISESNSYTDQTTAGAIIQMESYTDQAKSDAISKSNAYSDVAKAESIAESKIYADEAKNEAISESNGYTDQTTVGAISQMELYTDQAKLDALSETSAYTDQVKTEVISLAKDYTDSKVQENICQHFTWTENGVGIGTETIGEYKLAVEGTIGAREVKITTDAWADFVFEDDYDLMTLKELEGFIQTNKHLPEIPTAEEVEENGISVGEMNAKLLQKIEELTLYIIELKKENDVQNQKIKVLENK